MDDYLPSIRITIREPNLRRFLNRFGVIIETGSLLKVEGRSNVLCATSMGSAASLDGQP